MTPSLDPTLIPTIRNLQHSQALKCVWALEELALAKGLRYKVKNHPRIMDQDPEAARVSPMGKFPILTLESPTGQPVANYQVVPGIIMESRLIIQFVSDTWADGLWTPESDEDKTRDAYFQEFAMSSFGPRTDQPLIFGIIPTMLPFPLRQILGLVFRPIEKTLVGMLARHLAHMEDSLSDEKPWFAGPRIGISDFCFSFHVDVAMARGFVDAAKYPKVVEWHRNVVSRPAYQNAVDKGGGPDAYDLVNFTMR